MKIKFKDDCEFECWENYDEEKDHGESSMETFKAGEIVDIDIIDRNEEANTVDIQFGDGDVALSLSCDWFEEINTKLSDIEQHPIYNEVREAYADCGIMEESSDEAWGEFEKRRNLNYRASQAVDKQTAKALLEKAVVGYNGFTPDLLDHLPDDCEVTIAREGSVCLYVKGDNLPVDDLTSIADECNFKNGELRLWWD